MSGVKGRSGGRNAKTIERLKLEGTYDPKRHKNLRHPTPAKGTPVPPAPLTRAAHGEWTRMVTLLWSSELLTIADGAMLYQYCELHGAAETIKAMLRRVRGGSIKADQLRTKLLTQARLHRLAIRVFLVEFGGSPASRSRVHLSPAGAGEGQADDMSEFDRQAPLRIVRP